MAKVQAFNTQPFGNVFVFLISTRVRTQHPHHRTRTHAHGSSPLTVCPARLAGWAST
jgi:hypothetical protein